MSCVVISIQTSDGSERILWIKSGHWGDRWFKTHIEISEEEAEYRVCVYLYVISMYVCSGVITTTPPGQPLTTMDNTAIEEVIYVVKEWASREIFFQGDKVGEPITPLETQLRIPNSSCTTEVNLADDKEGSSKDTG